MSTPPPPHPHVPQPPPPQGPYGGPPVPAQGPYPPQPAPVPAQAPYGPYAPQPPQGPYAPHPPQPYGWAGPPPPKRRVGLVLGIVGGVVGAVVALVVVLVLIGRAAVGGFPEAENRLTLPKTLVDGRFALAQDLSESQGRQIEDEADGAWDAKDLRAVVGQYNVGGDNTKGLLLLSGMYGRFKNTTQMRVHLLKGAARADGVTLVAGPKDFAREGEPTIGCEVLEQRRLGARLVYPVCAWGDGNTGAAVGVTNRESSTQTASDVDLAFYARLTRQVRGETVEPIG
ncbi:hypothetical protein [Streptomyces griseoaurantiacus]|uniref:hypothetical protein n=1 Tax=Streptomyces griseoaurantiacus TaxID=68213 RepID=UPI000B856013|nr:hypothetical protein [Streptomyces jietaisiensis]